MIKLTDLLEAEKAFTATSKETGNVAVFKTKAARDAAVKAGSHEKRKTDKDDAVDVPTGEKKPNMFSKDAGYDAPDTDKSKKSKPKLDNAYDAKDFESIVSSLKGKIDDQEYEEISDEMKALEVMQDEMQDLEDDGGNTYNEKMEIDSAVEDLQDRIKQALSAKKESSTKLKSMLPEGLLREGTRSQVGVIDRSGKIASAYVHFDGYPSNMKKGLKKHMKNEKDVLTLIKKGGARGIFDDKPIEYYNEKPSPIKGNMKTLSRYIKSADSRGGAEYVYLYNMKDKKWYYADTYEDNELKKLY